MNKKTEGSAMQHSRVTAHVFFQGHLRRVIKPALIGALVLAVSGCGGIRGRTQVLWKYTLDYPPPAVQALKPVSDSLRVNLFTVVQSYNTTAMVYQPAPFKLQQYQRSAWRVNPGDMVTDYLLRDLRKQNLFKAVFSYRELNKARFSLEGEIEEFAEVDEPAGKKAVLSVYVTLLDNAQKEVPKMIVCHKNYRVDEPFAEKGPAGFAQGMSRAMEKFSQQLTSDLSRSIPPQ
jgi:ABC-type uncharacterized transport system auxiliary subunit